MTDYLKYLAYLVDKCTKTCEQILKLNKLFGLVFYPSKEITKLDFQFASLHATQLLAY